MQIFDEKNYPLCETPRHIPVDYEVGDVVTIISPPEPRIAGWFPHPWLGYSGVIVDYQRRPNGDPYGRVLELQCGDVHGRRVCVFDDRELRKGRL